MPRKRQQAEPVGGELLAGAALRARRQELFLEAYARLGQITGAAQFAGVGRGTVTDWRKASPAFAEAMAQAELQAADSLEAEARRRAIEGTDEPVYQGGTLVGTIRKYSDTLLIFLLKGALPLKYRERVEVTVDVKAIVARVAAERGLDPDDVMAEAERILSGGT